MAISFPSTEYFEALKAQMAANEEKFRRLGFIDTTFGVSVGVNGKARNFVLEFEVFDLKNVSEVPAIDLKKVDFQIQGDSHVWREMIENIRRNGEADSSHDINTLAHFGERLKIVYDDPDGHDKLYRFMESIQEFFDLSSKIEVSFQPRAEARRRWHIFPPPTSAKTKISSTSGCTRLGPARWTCRG